MVGPQYDFFVNPLGVVRSTFDKAVANGTHLAALDGKDWGAADLFRQFLFDDGRISQVPMLNSASIKWLQPKTLVRFRGLVQDMLSNEYYVGAYKDGNKWVTNKFIGNAYCPIDGCSETRMWERHLLYCVSVPGQNSWVEPSYEASSSHYADPISPQREKRQREDNAETCGVDNLEIGHGLPDSSNNKKMRVDDVDHEFSHPHEISTHSNTPVTSMVTDVEGNSFSCVIKIYDSLESDIKLNDVIEFVGVFTFESDLDMEENEKDHLMDDLCEDALLSLPPNKVPRLDCILYRKLTINDLLTSPPGNVTRDVKRELREPLLGHLTSVLGNDLLAAEYLLLHLLSRVHARIDSIPIGKLSLNLTGFNGEIMSVFGNRLKAAMSKLLPYTQHVPLTVHYLNTVQFAPKKDYKTNRLVSGFLQLAEGSHLIIDETPLRSGTLDALGCENAELMKRMVVSQKVEYDFTYYKMEMDADIQLLILSEGKSNILPADLILPFYPSKVESDVGVSDEMLNAWRWYLGTMKSLPHSIDQAMQKVIEDDLVAARTADRSLGSQDFSRWLTMSRLMSISFGETSLSIEHWGMVKELERQRKERLGRYGN